MIVAFGGPMTRIERAGLALGLALACVLVWPVRDHVVDGTYIWLQYARHLAHGTGLVFNPGERIHACTSPLWVALVADGMAVGLDGLAVARTLGFLATLASIGLFLQLMRRTVRSPAVRALATLSWSGQAWMLTWSCTGIETPLALALVLGGFVAFTEGKQWGERPVRAGSLWALAALTRSGAVLLMLLWVVALVVDANNRRAIRRLVFGIAPVLVIYGSWLAFARVYYGSFWPTALSAAPAHGVGWLPALASLGAQLRVAWGGGGVLAAALFAAVLFGGRRPGSARRSALACLPWAWLVALPVLYAARGLEVDTRQLLLVAPVGYWLAWRAVERWWSGEQPGPHAQLRAAVLAGLLAALVLVQNIAVYRGTLVPSAHEATAALQRSCIVWGERLRREAPRGAAVATPVIGAIGYTSGLRVVDLSGHVSPAIAPLLDLHARRDLVPGLAFSRVARPAYVVDDASPTEMLARSPYRAAFTLLDSAAGRALYRVNWARVDTLMGAHP